MARVIDYDPASGQKTLFHKLNDDEYGIETVSDVGKIAELNKAQYAGVDERAGFGDHNTHVARIPKEVVEQLMRSGVWYDEDRLKAWLNDTANRVWRTRPGRV